MVGSRPAAITGHGGPVVPVAYASPVPAARHLDDEVHGVLPTLGTQKGVNFAAAFGAAAAVVACSRCVRCFAVRVAASAAAATTSAWWWCARLATVALGWCTVTWRLVRLVRRPGCELIFFSELQRPVVQLLVTFLQNIVCSAEPTLPAQWLRQAWRFAVACLGWCAATRKLVRLVRRPGRELFHSVSYAGASWVQHNSWSPSCRTSPVLRAQPRDGFATCDTTSVLGACRRRALARDRLLARALARAMRA